MTTNSRDISKNIVVGKVIISKYQKKRKENKENSNLHWSKGAQIPYKRNAIITPFVIYK